MSEIHVAITGMRPKTMGSYDMHCTQYFNIKELIYNTLYDVCQEFPNDTIVLHVGGAPGVDQWAFEKAYELKDYFNIRIELDIPFKYQYQKWPKSAQQDYFRQCDLADKKVFVDTVVEYKDESAPMHEFSAKKLFNRNHYMVDKSSILLAFWDYESKGTGETVQYGKLRNRVVRIFDLRPLLKGIRQY